MKTKILFVVFILCTMLAIDANAQLGAKQYKKHSTNTGLITQTSNSLARNTIMASKGSRLLPLQLGNGFSLDKIIRSNETGRPIYIETSNLLKSTSYTTPEQKMVAENFIKEINIG